MPIVATAIWNDERSKHRAIMRPIREKAPKLKTNCGSGVNIVRRRLKTVQTSRAEVVGNEYINHDYCERFFSREMLVDGGRKEEKRGTYEARKAKKLLHLWMIVLVTSRN